MATRKYRRRFEDKIEDRDPNVMWLERSDCYVVRDGGRYLAVGKMHEIVREADILLHTDVVTLGKRVDRGHLIEATTPSWLLLRDEVLADPSLLSQFLTWPRRFEEFVAGDTSRPTGAMSFCRRLPMTEVLMWPHGSVIDRSLTK